MSSSRQRHNDQHKQQLDILDRCFSYLLNRPTITYDRNGKYPIHTFKALLDQLESSYIDYPMKNKNGDFMFNMLHITAQNNYYLEFEELLNNRKASLEIRDAFNRRPYKIASQVNSYSILKIIEKYYDTISKSKIQKLEEEKSQSDTKRLLLKRKK